MDRRFILSYGMSNEYQTDDMLSGFLNDLQNNMCQFFSPSS
jgi:hypothetical protein